MTPEALERKRARDRAWYARNREAKIAKVIAYQRTDRGRATVRRNVLNAATRRREAWIQRHESELTK